MKVAEIREMTTEEIEVVREIVPADTELINIINIIGNKKIFFFILSLSEYDIYILNHGSRGTFDIMTSCKLSTILRTPGTRIKSPVL